MTSQQAALPLPGSRPQHALPRPKPALEAQAVVLLAQSTEDVFHRCVELALEITRATTVVAALHRAGPDTLDIVAAAGTLSAQAIGRSLPRGAALGWRVIDSGRALLLERPQLCPDAHFLSGRPQTGMYLGVPLLDPAGQVLGVLSVDTTDNPERLSGHDTEALLLLGRAAGAAYSRLLALEQAQRSARQFERLANLSHELEGLTQPDEIARRALQVLLELSGLTTGMVFSLDPQGLCRLTVLEGDIGSGVLLSPWLRAPHTPTGLVAEVVRTGHSLSVPDYHSWRGSADAQDIHTAVAAPLRVQGRVVGVIGLVHIRHRHRLIAEGLTLLEMVAARIEQALERRAGLEHLQQTREAALRAVGRVLEGRDGETFGHTDRVTALALRLGHALGLSEPERQHLRWGAYLHDIGKVAVGDDVLRKPGPLSPQERALMQQHVVVGDDMLRDEAFVPREVRQVVRSHHERWDGGGYPDRLAGEAIPLLARIFSVVDVYDALVSERPYKRAWTHHDALAELRRCAGHQFDPRIVAVFDTLVAGDVPAAGLP